MYCVYLDQNGYQNLAIANNQCLPSVKSLPLNLTQDMNALLPAVTYMPYTTTLDLQANYLGYQTGVNLKFKQDTSHHHHIFVGDLCPYLQPIQLLEVFRPFGKISECKIIQDAQTLKSKGYGFVTFVQKEEAQKAIDQMNGKVVGSRAIRTNWAVRRSQNGEGIGCANLMFDDVMKSSSSNNCVIYCGGVQTGLTEELMYETFKQYGCIIDVKLFQDKGYAFVRFGKKEDAAKAIVDRHLSTINGYIVKCSWGKKSDDLPFQEDKLSPLLPTDSKYNALQIQADESKKDSINRTPNNTHKMPQNFDPQLIHTMEYQAYNLQNSSQFYSTAPIFAIQPPSNCIVYPSI